MRSCRSRGAHTPTSGAPSRPVTLKIVLPAAAELQWVGLEDSLEILVLMAEAADPRFDRSAARWIGRLLTETPPMTLKEVRWAVAMVEQLPRCRESLHRLARRR
jgi:hypothetical protein